MKIKFFTVVSLTIVLFLGACGGKSDADLQTDVDKALKGDVTTSGVTSEVNDGVATIKGDVDDATAKTKAEELANVKGVKSVTNEVIVKEKPTAIADDVDKAKIEAALRKAGFDNVTIDTSTRPKATLRGTVPKGKMPQAIQTAQVAAGKPLANRIEEK